MEVAEIGRKKSNQSVRPQQQPGQLRKYQHRDARLIEESEKMVKELQQQMSYIVRKFIEKELDIGSAKSKLASYRFDYGWSYGEMIYRNSELDQKKMEFEKLTFTHGAYRDNKGVLYFSLREPEVNIHNLNYRMLHEARSMVGERRLLDMANTNKHSNSGSFHKKLDQQICWLRHDLLMKCRRSSISDERTNRKKLVELEIEREQLFFNAPIKGSLWNSLPSTMALRKQIQSLETSNEKRAKIISERRKEIDSNKREQRKAENEIKSLRNNNGEDSPEKAESFANSFTP